MKIYLKFKIDELMVSKSQLFLIYSFSYLRLDSHLKNCVGEELTKIISLLFECEIIIQYMLTHVFLTLIGSKINSSDKP
jgi:hypothetical protein